jgi:microcystin-dependent protein
MPISNWSTTAADNGNADQASGILWPEGMAAKQVNDSARAMMAEIKKWYDTGFDRVGEVAFFAMATPPSGWLKANGAAVSRVTYASLFAAIGTTYGSGDGINTFNLPDLRGEFLRGWDDGRGVDTSRTFGSAQSSQNLAHTHTVTDSGTRTPLLPCQHQAWPPMAAQGRRTPATPQHQGQASLVSRSIAPRQAFLSRAMAEQKRGRATSLCWPAFDTSGDGGTQWQPRLSP